MAMSEERETNLIDLLDLDSITNEVVGNSMKKLAKQTEETVNIKGVEFPITEMEFPSGSILYNGDIPTKAKIRPITTNEEKILYGSSSPTVLDMVMNSCIVEPKGINLPSLLVQDKYALLINLRIISISKDYPVRVRCPYCGQFNRFDVDLSNLPFTMLDENFKEPYEVELKTIGKKIGIRLLRGKDMDDVDDLVERIKKKIDPKIDAGDIGYTMRMAKQILEIDGEKVGFDKALRFVEGWASKTSLEFRDAIDSIQLGYDIQLAHKCQNCGEDMDAIMPFTSDFFRPSRRR
jgi:hypothetical protein